MNDYKRLTAHKLTSFYDWERENLKPEQLAEMLAEIYDRLADLEDKIGSRTLIEFNKLEFNKPFVVLDYTSNGKEYYAIRIVEERDLAINLTKEKAEARLKELQEKQE